MFRPGWVVVGWSLLAACSGGEDTDEGNVDTGVDDTGEDTDTGSDSDSDTDTGADSDTGDTSDTGEFDTGGIFDTAEPTQLAACPLFISPSGSATAAGTITAPLGKFADALALRKSTCFDIRLLPGEYGEPFDYGGLDLVVKSTDGPEVTVIDGRLIPTQMQYLGLNLVTFDADETSAAVLEGVTLRGKMNGPTSSDIGAIRVVGADPTLRDLIVEANEGLTGGGIGLFDSHATLEGVRLLGNYGGTFGGGLYAKDSDLVLTDVDIVGNSSNRGGGLYLEDTVISAKGLRIERNLAFAEGGGAYLDGVGGSFENTSVRANRGDRSVVGHGLFVVDSPVTFDGLIVAGHEVDNDFDMGTDVLGVGMFLAGDGTTIRNATFHGNRVFNAPDGDITGVGLYLQNADVTITNTSFTKNIAAWYTTGTPGVVRGAALYEDAQSNATVRYGNAWGNSVGTEEILPGLVGTNGNIAVAPGHRRVIDLVPGLWDLRLASDSALVDAGDPALSDANGSRSDIGAYGGATSGTWPAPDGLSWVRSATGDVTWTPDFQTQAEAAGYTDCSYTRTYTGREDLSAPWLCPTCSSLYRFEVEMTDGLDDCWPQVGGSTVNPLEWIGRAAAFDEWFDTLYYRGTVGYWWLGTTPQTEMNDSGSGTWGPQPTTFNYTTLEGYPYTTTYQGELRDTWVRADGLHGLLPPETYTCGWPRSSRESAWGPHFPWIRPVVPLPDGVFLDSCAEGVRLYDVLGADATVLVFALAANCPMCDTIRETQYVLEADLDGLDVPIVTMLAAGAPSGFAGYATAPDDADLDLWQSYVSGPVFADNGYALHLMSQEPANTANVPAFAVVDANGWVVWHEIGAPSPDPWNNVAITLGDVLDLEGPETLGAMFASPEQFTAGLSARKVGNRTEIGGSGNGWLWLRFDGTGVGTYPCDAVPEHSSTWDGTSILWSREIGSDPMNPVMDERDTHASGGGSCTITVTKYGAVGERIEGTFDAMLANIGVNDPMMAIPVNSGVFSVVRGADQ